MKNRLPARFRALCAILAALVVSPSIAFSSTFYVSPTGNDSSAGTFDAPFRTIAKAVALSSPAFIPGDTILVRGGTYTVTATISIASSKSGTSTARYYLLAYPGERPILDCSSQAISGTNRGLYLRASYWHIKGLDIMGAGDNGMMVTGSNNIIEFCAFYGNHDTGLQLANPASNNRIINCDSYNNSDVSQGNADGFAPKLDVGTGNYFYGCRAWQNSDDGWDGYLRGANDVTTTIESCWCFSNGYLADGSASSGNGNGFKTGGSDDKTLKHNVVLAKCIAFDNRVKGFDQNNNRGSITILNGTAYRNGTNYGIGDTLASGKVLTLTNCVALGSVGSLHWAAVQLTNSWLAPFAEVTAADFVSIDTTGVRAPRKPDGSLPDIAFLVPTTTSQLVNAGTDVGLAFNGNAPDLGAFETDAPAGVEMQSAAPEGFALLQNWPNPFNPKTTIGIRQQAVGRRWVTLSVYDLLGREVAVLVNEQKEPGNYELTFDGAGLASGVYVCRLVAGGAIETKRMLLVR